MPTHRTKGKPNNPRPTQIVAARGKVEQSQSQAARVIHASVKTWQQWEQGVARMHPAFLELYLLKTGQVVVDELRAKP